MRRIALLVAVLALASGCSGTTDDDGADGAAQEVEPASTQESAALDEDDDADAATADDGDDGAEAADERAGAEGLQPLGEPVRLGDYELTVTSFVADATEAVRAVNEHNEAPEHGTYATATFDVAYLGDEEGMPGFDLTAVLVVDGVQYADYECAAVAEGDASQAPTLEKGGEAGELTFCFDHPGVDDDSRLFFEETVSLEGQRVVWDIG